MKHFFGDLKRIVHFGILNRAKSTPILMQMSISESLGKAWVQTLWEEEQQ